MAINRFRNSVQNMKDTVLIPTRLSDLIHTNSTISLSTPASSFDSVELSTSSNETSMESANVLSASHCTTLTNEHSYTRHNLYEQYKLLHLIDQILSSDAIISSNSIRNGAKMSESILIESDDNNNHNQNGKQLPPLQLQQQQHQQIATVVSSPVRIHHPPVHHPNHQQSEESDGTISPSSYIDKYVTSTNCSLDESTNCSLIRIKDKLEYHLVSLKNILNMMSGNADYITETYLDDIQLIDLTGCFTKE
ncbi:hypothetical protein RDWZM_006672 [Blomia tropicalis]|uniref:Mid1-interacting protein 1 n=1 Tax=Blomia tropicalis TaxID=40697 RepID=A0A9Q0M836_BLOTA|nr:hypothetical protein RDWZM_006672 [Blomia tropicalis]